ncbi:MAG: hypothetical protein MUE88_00245 [Flavobacteriales bacterium]|nr:hypothetical protein [Flavobacteriales bacterium]
MRRILAIVLVLAVVSAAAWTLLRWNRTGLPHSTPWRAIPERAAAVIIIPDGLRTWDRVSHTSQLWATTVQLPGASAVEMLLSKVKARMENDEVLRVAFSGEPVHIALMRNGSNALGCLFTGRLNDGAGEAQRALAEVLGLDPSLSNTLSAGDVVQLQVDTALPTLSLCVRDGVWMLGNSPGMMDEALLQWGKQNGLRQDSAFMTAYRTLGAGSDGHVLVRGDRLAELALLQWTTEAVEQVRLDERWVALDVRSRPDMLLLSGLVQGPADRMPFSSLHAQTPGPIDGARLLPRNVIGYRSWHISDPAQFLGRRDSVQGAAAFYSWVQGSVGVARAADSAATRWAILHASDPDLANERLTSLSADPSDTASYRGIRMRQLPPEPTTPSFFDDAVAPWGDGWWAAIGPAIVICSNAGALRASIDAWTDGRSLAEEPRTANWWARLGTEAGATWWSDLGRADAVLRPLLQPTARASWDRSAPLWSSIGNVSLYLDPGQRGATHITIALQFAPHQQEAAEAQGSERWAVQLHAPVIRTPEVFINHTNGTHEVLVQDALHRIHLIGSSGRVLWTRELDGPVLGAVQQIDRFRNGKLQYLFNTATAIQLIDRNGRDVGGFPVNLEHRASAQLSAFDYDSNGELRILVPLVNGGIANYSADGQAVKGWQPARGGYRTYPVTHLRIRNKDHLVLIDTSGTVEVVDRKGQARQPIPLKLGAGITVLGIAPGIGLEQSSVWWQGSDGAIYRATLEGRREQLAPPNEQRISSRLMDGGRTYTAAMGADTLVLGALGGTMHALPTLTLDQSPYAAWQEYKGNAVFGTALDDQLHVWTSEGRSLPGSPYSASGAWCVGDLDRDGLEEVIVADGNGRVVCLPIPAE